MKHKDKVFGEIYKASSHYKGDISGNESFFQKVTQSQLLDKLKEKYKQVKETLKEREKEIDELKATLKLTKINELDKTNKIYLVEIERLVKIIRDMDPKVLEQSAKFDLIATKNSLQASIMKEGGNTNFNIDKKINTLVEQNENLQNEMQEIHNIIKMKTFSSGNSIYKGQPFVYSSFSIQIQSFPGYYKKKTYYDDYSIDENLQKFLGESIEDKE